MSTKAVRPVSAAKKAAPTKKVAPAKKAAPAKEAAPAKKAAPARKAAPAKKAAAGNAASARSAPTPAAPPAPVVARFSFQAQPIVRDAGGLTPQLRAQLVWDARLSANRTTTPDRVPAAYLAPPGVIRWRISEGKKPLLDIVHNTAFLAGSEEPAGLERRAGLWVATGRGTTRGLALDLPAVAWDLNRDWPGRRLPLPPEPKRGAKFKPEPLADGEPYPDGTTFV
jgi:hypothetical protein